jgi:CubicO group peptidase (beta-lactamase class C family)
MKKLERTDANVYGIDDNQLNRFVAGLENMMLDDKNIEFHSYMILKKGKVILEGAFSPYQLNERHYLFSLTKSFTSIAIGIASDEGLLSLEDPITKYLSFNTVNEYTNEITIKHLLTMTAGDKDSIFSHPDIQKTKNWLDLYFSGDFDEVGSTFNYSTSSSYLLSVIISKVTNKNVNDYLYPRLFKQLDIAKPAHDRCPRGFNTGGYGMRLKTEDVAKFGQMLLNQGTVDGVELVSKEYIKAATSKQVANGEDLNSDWNQGYGYQFWQCRHGAYRGDGAFGQYCVVIPNLEMVIALNGSLIEMQKPLDLIWDVFIHNKELKKDSLFMGLELPDGLVTPEKFLNKKMDFDLNNPIFKCDKLNVKVMKSGVELTLKGPGKKYQIKSNNFEYLPGKFRMFLGQENTITKGSWINENEYIIEQRFFETPYINRYKIAIKENLIEVLINTHINFFDQKDIYVTGILTNN